MHICSHPEDYLRYSVQEGADTRNLMLKKYLKGLEEQRLRKLLIVSENQAVIEIARTPTTNDLCHLKP